MKLRLPLLTMLLTLLVFTAVTYMACSKKENDNCKNITCLNGGTCTDGKCACPDGFGGVNCEVIKNPCTGIDCLNGGTCENGICKCPPGYEGPRCENKVDSCISVVCQNGGTCISGKCYCPKGYEGAYCEILSRDKFKGTWTVFEDGTVSTASQYDVSITEGVSITTLKVVNFYNTLTTPLDISLNGDTLMIPLQIVDGYEIGGWGLINQQQNSIIFRYNVKNMGTGLTDYIGHGAGDPSIWTK